MLTTLSNMVMPLVVLGIVLVGMAKKVDVYDSFVKGAMDGLKIVVRIMPTLIGLMVAVGVLRASGFLTLIGTMFGDFITKLGLGNEVVPLMLIKMFSASAATGLVLDIFEKYGPDSKTGMFTSIMMSCTETCFYTMSVYFMASHVKKTRWTLPGALLATLAGILVSFLLVSHL